MLKNICRVYIALLCIIICKIDDINKLLENGNISEARKRFEMLSKYFTTNINNLQKESREELFMSRLKIMECNLNLFRKQRLLTLEDNLNLSNLEREFLSFSQYLPAIRMYQFYLYLSIGFATPVEGLNKYMENVEISYKYYREAKNMFKANAAFLLQVAEEISILYSNYAHRYTNLPDPCLRLFEYSLIIQKENEINISTTLLNIAIFYNKKAARLHSQGSHKLASPLYLHAIEYIKQIDLSRIQIGAFENERLRLLGICLEGAFDCSGERSSLIEALFCYNEYLKLNEKHPTTDYEDICIYMNVCKGKLYNLDKNDNQVEYKQNTQFTNDGFLPLSQQAQSTYSKQLQKTLSFFMGQDEHSLPTVEVALRRAAAGLRLADGRGMREQTKILNYLITEVTDINASSPTNGMTALHFAVTKGQIENIKLLLAAGADPGLCDKCGRTAKDYALDSSIPQIKALFNNNFDEWGVNDSETIKNRGVKLHFH
jgi:hypothetical protein